MVDSLRYHQMILQFDGQGGYVLYVFSSTVIKSCSQHSSLSTELDAEKRLALQEEKQALETKLLEVPKIRSRLAELKAVRLERSNSSGILI
jgi:ATP-binding cassette subfamily D (ALD) long-chain fatty acid import protein